MLVNSKLGKLKQLNINGQIEVLVAMHDVVSNVGKNQTKRGQYLVLYHE